MTTDELSTLLDVLRAKGVSTYSGGDIHLSFFEPQRQEPAPQPAIDEPQKCACGHLEHEHGHGGLCLLGCAEAKCFPDREGAP